MKILPQRSNTKRWSGESGAALAARSKLRTIHVENLSITTHRDGFGPSKRLEKHCLYTDAHITNTGVRLYCSAYIGLPLQMTKRDTSNA